MAERSSSATASPSMRIGILLCDHLRASLQPKYGDYPQIFTELLVHVVPDSSVTIYDVTQNQYPSRIDECDVYLISGSKRSCYEPEEWIIRLHDYVRQCSVEKRPLVGICFGHQVMARALGGEVARSSKGWGVGVHTYLVEKRQEIFSHQQLVRTVCIHQDQVIEPGKGGETVGGNDFSPNGIITYGDTSISTQGHPELSRAYAREVLEIKRDAVGEQAYRQALRDYAKVPDSELIAASLINYHRR